MAINKVVFGNEIQMDLTEDTVTEDKVLEGETFHDRSGNSRVGSLVIPVQDVEVNGESVVDEEGIAEVVVPVSGDVSTTDSFESYTGGRVESLTMEVKPIQLLNGYDHPWVGGAGKNKLDKDNYVLSYTSDNLVIIGTVNIESGKSYTFSCEQDKDLTGSTRNTLAVTYDGNTYYEMVNSNYHNEKGTHTYNFASNYTGTATLAFWCHTPSDTSITYSKFMFQEGVYTSFEPYENKCPISGHTQAKLEQRGKNRAIPPENGVFNGTNGAFTSSNTYAYVVADVEPNKLYTVSAEHRGNIGYVLFYKGTLATPVTNFISAISIGDVASYTFRAPEGCTIVVYETGGSAIPIQKDTIGNVQIELGSSATAYEPYQGKDYVINLGGTYYWLRGDVVSGKWYVVGQNITYDGSGDEGWSIQNVVDGNTLFISTVNIPLSNYSTKYQCSVSNPNTAGSSTSTAGTYVYNSTLRVRVTPDVASTVSDFTTWLSNNPLQVVYELATPIPIDLDPQQIEAFLGENNFSAPLDQQEIIEIIARNIAEFNEVIDDENVSDEFTYSSEKIEDRLDDFVDKDAVEEKSATDEFTTINGGLLSSCKVALSPNQDLHGYAEPWVGGAGKNKAPLVDKTDYGLTFVADELLGKMTMTGTATGDGWGAGIIVQINLPVGSYICSATNNPNNAQVLINYNPQGVVTSSGVTFNVTDATQNIRVAWLIASGTTYNNVIEGLMIRSASESDPTFEPYSNICPITGHTQVEVGDDGRNKLPNEATSQTVNGVTFDINNDGSIALDGQSTADWTGITLTSAKFLKAGTYTVSCPRVNSVDTRLIISYDGAEKVNTYNVDYKTFTLTEDKIISVRFVIRNSGVSFSNVTYYPMIEKGSTKTAYEPYNGYQITVNLGGTYYSGTLDVVSGVFTPDTAYLKKNSVNGVNSLSGTYYWTVENGLTSRNGANALSSHFKSENGLGGGNCYIAASGTQLLVVPADQTLNTKALADAWMADNEPEFVYKLATPLTIQLSPTMVKALVGENHLSAPLDGQEITESKYRELFTWDEVEEIAQSIADSKIDNLNTAYDTTFSSAFTEARYVKKIYEAPALTALQIVLSGAPSVTFNHQLIFSNTQTCCELIQFGSGARIGITDVAISQGSVTFTFDSPLTKAIGFRCRITNDFVS